MRIKRHKNARRAVKFYKVNYGFREPFKVLLDSNFIHVMIKTGLGEPKSRLERLLGGDVVCYTVPAVIEELRALGSDYKHSLHVSRKLCRLHSDVNLQNNDQQQDNRHSKVKRPSDGASSSSAQSPAEQIADSIGEDNASHFWIATQHGNLRQQLAKIPGCPLIYVNTNGLQLERPPEQARQQVQQTVHDSQAVPKAELASHALQDVEKLRKEMREKSKVRWRANRARAPNPLSVQQKGVEKGAGASGQQEEGGRREGGTKKKRQRRKT